MMRQLRVFSPSSLLVILALITQPAWSQDYAMVEKHESIRQFLTECDTLMPSIGRDSIDYEYSILFYEKSRTGSTSKMKYGRIIIRGDSVLRFYKFSPNATELFSQKPAIQGSTAAARETSKLKKSDKRWAYKLYNLSGFYSQFTVVNGRKYYPRNAIKLMIITDKQGQFFGVVKYGYNDDWDLAKMTGDQETLQCLIDFVFE